MGLDLFVDGDSWRGHLRRTVDEEPAIVPVAKGNGYGFGLASLARRASWLGCDTLAVGTYREVPEVASRFAGDVMVLEPWRPYSTDVSYGSRIVHTVGRAEDVTALERLVADGDPRGPLRVVLEGLTSMSRFGLDRATFARLSGHGHPGLHVEGHALHLPLGSGHAAEVADWLVTVPHARWYLSHLAAAELADLRRRHPGTELRPRVGTALWLGDPRALSVRATVLDARQVQRGDRVGYRQRRLSAAGTMLVVSGGTSHGIGLEAPSGAASATARAKVLVRGGLDAVGRARSPFSVAGTPLWFVEPPHMQVSLVFVPSGLRAPSPGETVAVRVRHTTARFDAVHLD